MVNSQHPNPNPNPNLGVKQRRESAWVLSDNTGHSPEQGLPGPALPWPQLTWPSSPLVHWVHLWASSSHAPSSPHVFPEAWAPTKPLPTHSSPSQLYQSHLLAEALWSEFTLSLLHVRMHVLQVCVPASRDVQTTPFVRGLLPCLKKKIA